MLVITFRATEIFVGLSHTIRVIVQFFSSSTIFLNSFNDISCGLDLQCHYVARRVEYLYLSRCLQA